MNSKKGIIVSGAVIGLLGSLLVLLGNPLNMGVCVACFIRDIAGSLGMHRAAVVQNIRLEIVGFILGAFIISKLSGEFKVRGGSSPIIRFFIAIFVMVGALVFLGCPLRMVLRLAGGDLNAILGIVGFAVGVIAGSVLLKKGFSLGRSYNINKTNGYILPILAFGFILLRVFRPEFIFMSEKGPGAQYVFWGIALAAGLIIGVLAQKSRICMAGGIRDLYLIKDNHLITGFISIFVFAFIVNNLAGNFDPGFVNQPVAHTDGLWNGLGMFVVGLGSVMLGGCPLRQTILAGQGNTDSAVTFMGYLTGGAVVHNFQTAASPAGVPLNGKIGVIAAVIFLLGTAYYIINAEKGAQKASQRKSA